MINVLVTGKSGYIAREFMRYMGQFSSDFHLDVISLRDVAIEQLELGKYDCILHLAGLAHVKEDVKNASLYYEINHKITQRLAKKAHEDGVGQFILASTLSVYGMESGEITRDTIETPITHYGKSKLLAEQSLQEGMKNCIVRIPMVYGMGCGGNYQRLAKLAKKIPIFPKVNNHRSMIYIEHLCEFFRLLIKNGDEGLFFPQNSEFVNTSEMVRLIAMANGRKVFLCNAFGVLARAVLPFSKTARKLFGSLTVDMQMSVYGERYCEFGMEETIMRTEGKNA